MSWQPPPTDANLNNICLEYSYDEVLLATSNFSAGNLLGKGAYGSVYRGELKDGTEVAIKVLHAPKEGGFKEEVQVLSKFRHPHLVILMGFARHGHQRFLVYELLQGGDVCGRLQRDPSFDYKRRISVAIDAALGLSHLHNSTPKVFHRDIKSQNILLDRNGSGRIADFGLALLARPNRDGPTGVLVDQCSGTLGYADPLYIASSIVTERREVYSFGMVLLEMLTGLPPAIIQSDGKTVQYPYEGVKGKLEALMGMVSSSAGGSCYWPSEISRYWGQLALACVQDSEIHRPVFVEIVSKLRKLQHYVSRKPSPAAVTISVPVPSPSSPASTTSPPPQAPAVALLYPQQLVTASSGNQSGVSQLESQNSSLTSKHWNPFEDLPIQQQLPQRQANTPLVSPRPSPVVAVVPPSSSPSPPENNDNKNESVQEEELNKTTVKMESDEVSNNVKDSTDMNNASSVEATTLPLPSIRGVEEVLDSLFGVSSTKEDDAQNKSNTISIYGDEEHQELSRTLLEMGFKTEQVQEALQRNSSVRGAVDWILSKDWSDE